MIIPISSLSAEILHNIIANYVLQEGTEYGLEDVSLDDKIAQVHQQLLNGSAVLVYSELHETVNILPAEQFKGA
ncbi:YheU family protein [Thalassotalea agariperforans]